MATSHNKLLPEPAGRLLWHPVDDGYLQPPKMPVHAGKTQRELRMTEEELERLRMSALYDTFCESAADDQIRAERLANRAVLTIVFFVVLGVVLCLGRNLKLF